MSEQSITSTKQCAKCKEWKSVESFTIDRRNKSGRYCYCRQCNSKSAKPKINVPTGSKLCSKIQKCINPQGPVLPATTDYFPHDRTKSDGFCSTCKVCTQQKNKDSYRKNPQKHIQATKIYHKAHPEVVLKSARNYRQTHIKERREYNKRYSREHRTQRLARWHKRHAKIALNEASVTGDQLRDLLFHSQGKCYYCGKKIKGTPHLDHVIPLSRGGLHDIGNLVVSCAHCNTSKGAKMPHEWKGGSGRLL